MPKRTSAADATPRCRRRHRDDGQSSGRRDRARADRAAAGDAGSELACTRRPNGQRRPAALERCRADIARGDIVIATMLFLEEHIRAVLPALRRAATTATRWCACMSAGEVVRLTRIGSFDMSERDAAVRWRC